MTPYTFLSNDSRKELTCNPKGSKSTRCTLYFKGQNIVPSKMLAEQLKLKRGAHVAITVDEDKPSSIFIRRADDLDDNSNTQTAKVCWSSRSRGTYKFCSVAVVKHILSVIEAESSAVLFVAPKPTNICGKEYFRIITESPYSTK